MIQRIQTLYLLAAFVLAVAAIFLPIGTFTDGVADIAHASCLCVQPVDGITAPSYTVLPLAAVLAAVAFLSIYAIFAFANRRYQSRLCLFSIMLLIGWYILYAVCAILFLPHTVDEEVHFVPSMYAVLPLFALVAILLARHGILADEKLVRDSERIR